MKNLVFNSEEHTVKISFLDRINKICELIPNDKKYCVILDKKVANLHTEFFEELKLKDFSIFIIDAPEKQKNINTCLDAINLMQKEEFNRNDAVIGIGGGAITDLAGFVASSYMRGITYLQIPTSLLAQVDASIGGKTGINHGNIKNFIGSFYNPSEIIICAEFLKSLNQQEFLNGFSEVLKHSIITSKTSLDNLKNLAGEINNRETHILLKLIEESIDIKAQVVTEDFKEKGKRKFLNFTNEEMVKYIVGRGSKRTSDRIEKEVMKQIRDVTFKLGLGGVSTQSTFKFHKEKQRHIQNQCKKMKKKVRFPKNFLNTFYKVS